MKYFRILGFEKLQHYRDRKPPWIKLYRDLWRDPTFSRLPIASRYELLSLMMLASQHDNKLPEDQEWLRREIAQKPLIDLKTLVDTGFISYVEQNASNSLAASATLASCKQNAILETETETETERTPLPPSGAFDAFWSAYPRKVGKDAARKAWNRIHPANGLSERIIAAVEAQKTCDQWQKDGGQFIPHPTTWLNRGSWQDETTIETAAKQARLVL